MKYPILHCIRCQASACKRQRTITITPSVTMWPVSFAMHAQFIRRRDIKIKTYHSNYQTFFSPLNAHKCAHNFYFIVVAAGARRHNGHFFARFRRIARFGFCDLIANACEISFINMHLLMHSQFHYGATLRHSRTRARSLPLSLLLSS